MKLLNAIRKPIVRMSLQVAYWVAFWNIYEPLCITREHISLYVWISCSITMVGVSVLLIPAIYRVLVGESKPGRKRKVREEAKEDTPVDL